jgi:hypothetical protein
MYMDGSAFEPESATGIKMHLAKTWKKGKKYEIK